MQGVPFIVSPRTASLTRPDPRTPWYSRGSCLAQGAIKGSLCIRIHVMQDLCGDACVYLNICNTNTVQSKMIIISATRFNIPMFCFIATQVN